MQRWVLVVAAVAVLLAAVVGGRMWMDARAARQAEAEQATQEVRDAIATQYDALNAATTMGHDAAALLQVTLQEHLTVSERSDEDLATDRDVQRETLDQAGTQLAEGAEAPAPEVPPEADESAVSPELDALSDAKQRAGELAERFSGSAAAAGRWGDTLAELRARADQYVETVENQPDTSDPQRLQTLWEEELEVLEEYEQAAEEAADVPGLEPIARAYLDYVRANISFASEAIELLEEGEIDRYNERLRETYGNDDPFGFQDAVAAATQESIDAGVLRDLQEVRDEAAELASFLTSRLNALRPESEVTPPASPTAAPSPA